MTNYPEYSYLDPTYPAYYWYFNRPKTLLCFSLRRFILILTIYDIILSSGAISFSLISLLLNQLNSTDLFPSNGFFQTLTFVPIALFFDNRIQFQIPWPVKSSAQSFYTIMYLHIILNGSLLLSSISMLTAIKYHKPNRASIYFVSKIAHFVNITTLLVGWFVNHEENSHKIRLFYGNGNLGLFTPDVNISCLILFECLWKTFSVIMIFRSIQYIRDYSLHKGLNSIKNFNDEHQSSTQLVIHIISNNTDVDKQYHV